MCIENSLIRNDILVRIIDEFSNEFHGSFQIARRFLVKNHFLHFYSPENRIVYMISSRESCLINPWIVQLFTINNPNSEWFYLKHSIDKDSPAEKYY